LPEAAADEPQQPSANGAQLLAEIREQPAALARLLGHEDEFRHVGEALGRINPTVVRLVGHGSSDNAASYGVYAFGLLPSWTAFRDSISLTTYYDARLDLSRSAVVALSQSGRTPDVVDYVQRATARGAHAIAITNDPASELGEAADAVLPLDAGPERAVAATKTYLNQVAALALLAAYAAGRGPEVSRALPATIELLECAIAELEPAAAPVAVAFTFVGRMFVVGRGIEFGTAREVALKLTETCRVAAEPFTATDLAHGPVAALDPLFPVWTIAAEDESLPAVVEAARRARATGATVVATGSAASSIDGAAFTLASPRAPNPLLSPILSVIPGQLFAWALANAKGLDPDEPRGLSKVTLAA
jgi:glucosamine--fructose-6-phosphate aminotransferase (isomerizing)